MAAYITIQRMHIYQVAAKCIITTHYFINYFHIFAIYSYTTLLSYSNIGLNNENKVI